MIGLIAPELVLFSAWYQVVRAGQAAEMVSDQLPRGRAQARMGKEKRVGDRGVEHQQPQKGDSSTEVKRGEEQSQEIGVHSQDLESGIQASRVKVCAVQKPNA